MKRHATPFLLAAAGLLLFAVTLALFIGTARNGYMNIDDLVYVRGNDRVTSGLSLRNIGWALLSLRYAACWMPLTWLSYMTDVTLFGPNPGALHAVNALFHACNAVLLFALLHVVVTASVPQAGRGRPAFPLLACLAAALVWALHPLRVEPVAWIASRKDVLSLFWELLALLLWARAVTAGDLRRPSALLFRLSFACFCLALLAKPTAMTFPLLAALLEFLLTGRVLARRLAAPGGAALFGALVSIASQRAGGAMQALSEVPLYGRALNAVAALGCYARDTVWPLRLAVPYHHRWPSLPDFFWPSLLICAVLAAALLLSGWRVLRASGLAGRALRTRRPEPCPEPGDSPPPSALLPVSLLFVLVAVGPMIGIANFGYHSHADRFTYLPALGLSLLLAGGLVRLALASRAAGAAGLVLTALAAALLARQTRVQLAYWRDEEALFTHTLEVTGDNVVAHRSLGIELFRKHKDLPRALRHFGRSIEMGEKEAPHYHRALYVMMLAETGRLDEARAEARELNERPDNGVAGKQVSSLLAYGAISLAEGDLPLAREQLSSALALGPKIADGYYLMGELLAKENRRDEALRYWRKASELDMRFDFLKERLD